MSLYDQIDEGQQDKALAAGVYVATLDKAKVATSKKGDPMIVVDFKVDAVRVTKWIVIRPDLSRMWTGDLAKLGLSMTDILARAREDDLTLEQLVWAIADSLLTTRLGSEVEIAVSYQQGNDLASVTIRSLVRDPIGTSPADPVDDDIPF